MFPYLFYVSVGFLVEEAKVGRSGDLNTIASEGPRNKVKVIRRIMKGSVGYLSMHVAREENEGNVRGINGI